MPRLGRLKLYHMVITHHSTAKLVSTGPDANKYMYEYIFKRKRLKRNNLELLNPKHET